VPHVGLVALGVEHRDLFEPGPHVGKELVPLRLAEVAGQLEVLRVGHGRRVDGHDAVLVQGIGDGIGNVGLDRVAHRPEVDPVEARPQCAVALLDRDAHRFPHC
jgi:hypothetical protein